MNTTVLSCQDLSHLYCPTHHSMGACSFQLQLKKGHSVGLVGESGSGKSTIAKMLCRFICADSGTIELLGKPAQQYDTLQYYKHVQYIPQQPAAFFHPKRTIYDSLLEVLLNFNLCTPPEQEAIIIDMLTEVGLTRELADRYPHQLSGGECQRASIARALLVQPDILICDEITSALDVTIQASIMRLLKSIRSKHHTAFLFISHDLALVSQFCEEMIVLKNGHVVEQGDTSSIITAPKHPYTKLLLQQYHAPIPAMHKEETCTCHH